ncbi:MAG: bifunctional 5,10-methylenetetrahydrofolate dehydrogenase/5,10-methenyltetrahydrofolate cyclohydrolase [bacterium]|nr:bifunctional 5,10-methylenetetrahydrofolate dehydrogenase/5,10-methenyltetrahydrofolate cyclohydrolase [bacterium]
MKIDGKQIAQKILEELKVKIQKLNIIPNLAIILVGDDPASIVYVNQKKIKAELIGAKTTIFNLKSTIQNSELEELIDKLNKNSSIHGIIVQQPLPPQINIEEITQSIDPQKDVDGFHTQSKFEPPIADAVLEILKPYSLKTKKIVIIGKGETGGKLIIQAFKKTGISPIVIDSKTENPQDLTKIADIIISAVGKSDVLKADMIKKGAILISIGMHKCQDDKLHGDYDENQIKDIASFYTPTPGGVGPVNVAMLLKNLVNAAETSR